MDFTFVLPSIYINFDMQTNFVGDKIANLGLIDFKIGLYIKVKGGGEFFIKISSESTF